jgi:RNA polymerase sigma-70 factor, ECF subfamily
METGPHDLRTSTRGDRECFDDRGSFDEIAQRHRATLHHLARRLAPIGVEPEDIVQESLIRAYRAFHQFRGDCSLQSWLYRITLNVIHSQRTRRAADPLARLAAVGSDDTSAIEAIPSHEDPERAFVVRRAVAQALAALPRPSREILVLRHLRGLEYAEIAAMTGAPLGTVESRLFRARRKLRPLLASLDVQHTLPGVHGSRDSSR